jgi:hypothetical protein
MLRDKTSCGPLVVTAGLGAVTLIQANLPHGLTGTMLASIKNKL